MGFKPGIFWGSLIAVVEFFGGIAIVLGLYAELATALFGFQMIVGTFWKLRISKFLRSRGGNAVNAQRNNSAETWKNSAIALA